MNEMPADTRYTGSKLVLDAATGNLQVDTEVLGDVDIKLGYQYYTTPLALADNWIPQIKVKVVCPALTLSAPS